MLTSRNADFARLIQLAEQGECGPRYPPVLFAVTGFAHREVVGERHEGDSWRDHAVLHGQRNGGDAPSLYGVADQSDGPVAQGSRGREQHDVDLVFHQFACDLGGGVLYQRGRVVNCAHKGEVASR